MDYKKIIKSRELRLFILRILSFIPDKTMIKLQYRIKTRRKLNLKNPQRFTEKLQWYKLYYRNEDMVRCVDKADVRGFVKEKGLEEILIPCLGVYDNPNDINWDELPNSFVIKDTLGMGGSSVIIVKDKKEIDLNAIKAEINKWVKTNAHIRSGGREWPYYSGKNHRVILEEYLESDEEKGGLIDYKFFCFNGAPTYLYVITDRKVGEKACFGIYDSDFKQINAYRIDEKKPQRELKKPEEFERMKVIAQTLSQSFPEVRVDLYNVNGNIFFGEMTFWDGSGYMKFEPDEFDFELGKAFKSCL